jgi:hypothetical protein
MSADVFRAFTSRDAADGGSVTTPLSVKKQV